MIGGLLEVIIGVELTLISFTLLKTYYFLLYYDGYLLFSHFEKIRSLLLHGIALFTLGGALLSFGAVDFVIAYGLWNSKKWTRMLSIILRSVEIFVGTLYCILYLNLV